MRWLIRSILALVLLVGLIFGSVFLIPADRVARIVTDKFTAITGRALTIEGSVKPSFWPTLGVQTGPVTVANADWSTEGPMLRAEGLEIGVDLSALIGGEVKITRIRAMRPQIVLERARDGRENWVFGGPGGGSATPGMAGEGTPFTLDLAEIEAGALSFIDHGAGRRVTLGAVTGQVRIPDFDGRADVTLSAEINGQTAQLTAEIAQFASFLDGSIVGVDLALSVGDANLGFAGRAGFSPISAQGALTADLADLSAITKLAGSTRPDLPQGLGAGSVTVAGDLTLTPKGSMHLRGGRVVLDGSALTVEADLTTDGPRPKLTGKIGAGALQLAVLAKAPPGDGTAAAASPGGWSTAPIDVSGLAAIDAVIALTADSLDLGTARFGATRLVMTLDRARAVFELAQLAAYQGNLTGQFVVNGRDGLSLGGNLTATGVAMQPLLQDLSGYDRLIGTSDLALKFLAVGNSVDALMRSLSGSGSFGIGKGELRGLDVSGMLRTLDPNFVGDGQKTIFDTITASYTIDKGVLANDDLTLRAPYVTATGTGQVGIGARTLDYRLRPTAMARTDGTGGVMVPLLITGTWAAPKFRLDLESIARERLADEAKALEARAKAELEAKAAAELGVVRNEGESLEDAAKRRAQEAIEAETGRLLNRLLGNN